MLDQNPLSRAWAALTTHTPLHTLVYAIVGVYLARFVYTTFLYARFFSPLRKMPGPSYGHWLLGRLPEVVTGEAGSAVTAWTEQYGRSIRFMGMLGVERVCFLNYKDLKQILVDEPYSECGCEVCRAMRVMLSRLQGSPSPSGQLTCWEVSLAPGPPAWSSTAVLTRRYNPSNRRLRSPDARKCRAFGAAVRLLQSP
jgi:hypothetical protein